jgi:hypothetical protein
MQIMTERQRVSRRTPDWAEMTDGGEYRAPETLDKVGATASLLCAIHCALMPLVITLLPLVGLSFLADSRVEWALIALSATLGVTSLCLGYREHRSRRALGVLGAGLGLLALGRIMEQYSTTPWGVPIVVLGGVTIAGAHLLNRLLCQSCRRCHTHGH